MPDLAFSPPLQDADLWTAEAGGDRQARPEALTAGDLQHARMFELSHLYGPLIGLALCLFLIVLGFPLDYRLAGFSLLVCAFWPYLLLLRRIGRYRLLSLCSLHHLMLVILWASHGYGGLASPFLLWLALVPLLAFLYLPPRPRLWLGLILSLTAHTLLFVALCLILVPPPPVPVGMLQNMALLSILCASAYVAMMAVYFGQVLTSRRELQLQADSHRDIAAGLAGQADAICASGEARLAMIRHLSSEAGGPLEAMRLGSAALAPGSRSEADGDDARSVAEAVFSLETLISDIQCYAQMDGARAEIHRKPSSLADILETAAQRIRPLLDPPARMVVRQDRDVDDLVNTDGTLLAEAIFYVGRHLALGLAGRTGELRAVRLPVGNVEHIVIDLAAADDVDAPANAVAIFDAQTLERPATNTSVGGYGLSLAVAHRICVLLGGSLLSSARTDDSPRFRILVPNLKD